MKRRGKAGSKTEEVRRPRAAGRKRLAVAKAKSPPRAAAGLQERLERSKQELNEALQQQAATSEVLRLISAAPGDLQRVFSVILESATRLCQANFGTLYLAEGDFCRAVAMHNATTRIRRVQKPPTTGAHHRHDGAGTPGEDQASHPGRRHGGGCGVSQQSPGAPLRKTDPRAQPGHGADAQGQRADRPDHGLSPGSSPLRQSTGRPADEFRRPGRHRHRECAAAQRAAAADD